MEKDLKIKYTKIKHVFMITDIFVTLGLFASILFFNLTHLFRDFSLTITNNFYLSVLIYTVVLSLFLYLFSLPLDFLSGYIIEHKFNLSNQTLFGWIKDNIKKSLISFVIIIPMIQLMYFFLRNFQNSWWLCISLIWIVITIILGKIFPVIIVPLFYKYKEINNDELKQRIFDLAKKANVKVKDIFEIDFSRDTKKANAAVIGLGKTRRIILADTLLESFTIDEIEAVIAHEMGHYKKKHIVKLLIFGAITTIVGFYLCSIVFSKTLMYFNINSIFDIAGLPLIGLFLFLFTLILMPIQNMYSRKLEYEADKFSLDNINNKQSFVSTMQKLADMNLSDENPNKIIEFLFYSHPSISKRIKAVK
jgi:STE24 endopeptidase